MPLVWWACYQKSQPKCDSFLLLKFGYIHAPEAEYKTRPLLVNRGDCCRADNKKLILKNNLTRRLSERERKHRHKHFNQSLQWTNMRCFSCSESSQLPSGHFHCVFSVFFIEVLSCSPSEHSRTSVTCSVDLGGGGEYLGTKRKHPS